MRGKGTNRIICGLQRDLERTRGKKSGFRYKGKIVFNDIVLMWTNGEGIFAILNSNVKESWYLVSKKLLIWAPLAVVYWNGVYANN